MGGDALIEQIKEAGLSDEQAVKSLIVIANYAKEKFPILEGNINASLKEELKKVDPEIVSRAFYD